MCRGPLAYGHATAVNTREVITPAYRRASQRPTPWTAAVTASGDAEALGELYSLRQWQESVL